MKSEAVRELIIKKYRATGYDKIAQFVRGTGSRVSEEDWGTVINRGNYPSLETFLKMSAELHCSLKEMHAVLVLAGQEQIADAWFNPQRH